MESNGLKSDRQGSNNSTKLTESAKKFNKKCKICLNHIYFVFLPLHNSILKKKSNLEIFL